jgi:ketosteroid isomerase-like protein
MKITETVCMSDHAAEILRLTQELLDAIANGDWAVYEKLCAPSLTAFEPEAKGQQVTGLAFHRFYFDLGGVRGKHHTTLVNPEIRPLGPDAALITYIRLVQKLDATNKPITAISEETRVWQRLDGAWKHVHFHRSLPS